MPPRRRLLGLLHESEELYDPRRREPHIRRARNRRRGNTDGSPASFTWVVDATAPSSTLGFPGAGGEYNGAGWDAGCTAAGLCGTYGDGSGTGVVDVEVSIRQGSGDYWDGSGFTSGSEVWNDATLAAGDWSYAFDSSSFPADGDYTVRVRARDSVGNTEAPSSVTFTFDATPPETSIDSILADPTSSTSASFDFSADEPGSTFECAIDGGAWSACTSPTAYSGLGDGGHTFEVRATDVAGNTDTNPASFSWTIDTVAPTSAASFPVDTGSYTAAQWDAGCTLAGLCGTYSDTGVGVVDVEVSIRQGSGDYWDGSGFTSGSEVWNDATLAAGDWSYAFDSSSFPADGDYTVRLRATDDAGNTESASSLTFTYDTAAPSSTLGFPGAGGEYNGAGWDAGCTAAGLCGTYGDSSGAGVVEVEVSIRQGSGDYWDGSGFTSGSEVWNDATLAAGDWSYAFDSSSFPADGDYTVRVRARDSVGNTEAPSSVTFTFDATDPTGSLTAPADGAAVRGSAVTVSSDSADTGSGVDSAEFQQRPAGGGGWTTIDTDSSASYSVSWDTTSLADGDYDLRVVTTDEAGNAFTSGTHTVTVDNSAPSTPVVSLSETSPYAFVSGTEIFVNTNGTGSFDVSAASVDSTSGIDQISFPAGIDDTTSPYSAAYDLDDLSGSQTVTAHDVAGNTASDTFMVTPDTAPPSGGSVDYPDGYDADGVVTITLDAGSDALSGVNPASGVLERQTSALVGGTCDPFLGPWSAVTSPDTVPDSTCARYRYRVSDHVSNEATYAAPTSTVKVDLTAPETAIDDAPSDPSSDASPSFEFSSDEPGSTLRVPPRRRRLGGMHVAGGTVGPCRRQPHVRGARDRRREQCRPHPGFAHVDDRHNRAEHLV